MDKPIEAGCRADVIDGAQGAASPNIGLRVIVLAYVGDHSKFGRIWRCKAEFAELAQPGRDVPPGQADFAQSWLRRLPDDPTPPAAVQTKEEISTC